MTEQAAEYYVALFDVLGFSNRLRESGLSLVHEQYTLLTSAVARHNSRMEDRFELMRFKESAYLAAGRELIVCHRLYCAYASDSFLLWAHALFPEARDVSESDRATLAESPEHGWQYLPIPADQFLSMCSELVCLGIEARLPLRGAISSGPAILDKSASTFLGLPIIEANELEKSQVAISVGLSPSYLRQHLPAQLTMPFSAHLKPDTPLAAGHLTLDWPRHWRRTRQGDLRTRVRRLRRGSGHAEKYYANTLDLIDASRAREETLPSNDLRDARSIYPQFGAPDVVGSVKAVRRHTVAK